MKNKKYLGKIVSWVVVSAVVAGSVPVVETLGAEAYKWEITPQFEEAWEFSDGLALVRNENKKYGYIDKTGEVVIPYQFRDARGFSEGLASVQGENGKWGYIDKTGEVVVACQFDDTRYFSEGLAIVTNYDDESASFGYIDKTGAFVIPYQYGYSWEFSEGLAYFLGHNEGYINKTGELVIPHKIQLQSSFSFSEGLAAVTEFDDKEYSYKWGYIDKTGEVAIPYQFEHAWDFSEGLAGVEDENGMWGYIDKMGEVVIPHQFEYASEFNEGMASVLGENYKWGYIDKTGDMVIPYQFGISSEFSEGLVAGEDENDKWGYIDRKGNVVIPYQFERALNFSEGVAAVKVNGEWGYISSPYTTTKFVAGSASDKVVQSIESREWTPLKVDGDILALNGRSYYPFRQLLESVGAEVEWDNVTKTATGTLNGNTVAFTLGESKYVVNGKTVKMDDAKLLVNNGKTYIPVRYALEGLGFSVDWDKDTGSVIIKYGE